MTTRSNVRRPMMLAAAAALGLASLGLARAAAADPYHHDDSSTAYGYDEYGYDDVAHDEDLDLAPTGHELDTPYGPYAPYDDDLYQESYQVPAPIRTVPQSSRTIVVRRQPVHQGATSYELDLRGRISLRDMGPLNRDEASILRRLGMMQGRHAEARMTRMESRVAAQVVQARRMFVALDRDRDGRLFRKETRGWLQREFHVLDRNRNLAVSWAEVQRALVRDLRRPASYRPARPAGLSGWIRINHYMGSR